MEVNSTLSYPPPRGVLVPLAWFLGSHTVFICGAVRMFVDTCFPWGLTVCVQNFLLFPSKGRSTLELQAEVVEVMLPLRISLALEQLRWQQAAVLVGSCFWSWEPSSTRTNALHQNGLLWIPKS